MTITEQLEPKVTREMEYKYFPTFEKRARHAGNGVYHIMDMNKKIYSTDTRELFLMYVAAKEGIKYEA